MSTTYILDGFLGSHARWEGLRRRIESNVGPCHIWRYDNSGKTSLEVLADRLVSELRTMAQPFHLVGYSMGGLVVRETLRQAPELPLNRAALLHSPHSGSFAAHFLPLKAAREMRPGSPFLRRLDENEWKYPTLATWCTADLVVLPGTSARWKSASHLIRSPVPAHAWPIFSRRIHEAVTGFLSEGSPSSS